MSSRGVRVGRFLGSLVRTGIPHKGPSIHGQAGRGCRCREGLPLHQGGGRGGEAMRAPWTLEEVPRAGCKDAERPIPVPGQRSGGEPPPCGPVLHLPPHQQGQSERLDGSAQRPQGGEGGFWMKVGRRGPPALLLVLLLAGLLPGLSEQP